MALGDGIRRNIATVSSAERDRFRDAILALNTRHYPGSRTDFPAGGVSHWFKQDEIHQATHVHGGPAFAPWHREICNHLEALLREIDPELSLHYWDWSTDPHPLFTAAFMGSSSGDAGEPWLSGGLYNPSPSGDAYRNQRIHGLTQPTANPSTWSYPLHANPADPPRELTRSVGAAHRRLGAPVGRLTLRSWPRPASPPCGPRSRKRTTRSTTSSAAPSATGIRHSGTLSCSADSNVDRLFAMWQTAPDHSERLDPDHVYDPESADPAITDPLQPWTGTSEWPVRPWYSPENEQVVRNCKHPAVVRPPSYDTLPTFPGTVTLETLRR